MSLVAAELREGAQADPPRPSLRCPSEGVRGVSRRGAARIRGCGTVGARASGGCRHIPPRTTMKAPTCPSHARACAFVPISTCAYLHVLPS